VPNINTEFSIELHQFAVIFLAKTQSFTTNMTKKVLIMIATGSETVEIVAPVDTLRRVEGIEVTIASIYGKEPVKTVEGILITPDIALTEVDKDAYDAVIMPGGLGYTELMKSKLVGEILKNQYNKGKLVAGICMSPNVFLANEIGLGNKLTSYPYLTEALREKYEYLEEPVVQDKVNKRMTRQKNSLKNFRSL
jgi:putative intracellular protease/amidase